VKAACLPWLHVLKIAHEAGISAGCAAEIVDTGESTLFFIDISAGYPEAICSKPAGRVFGQLTSAGLFCLHAVDEFLKKR
jgi:hypothetical protein